MIKLVCLLLRSRYDLSYSACGDSYASTIAAAEHNYITLAVAASYAAKKYTLRFIGAIQERKVGRWLRKLLEVQHLPIKTADYVNTL